MKYLKYFPSLEKYTTFLESEEYKTYLPKVVFCEENDELSYVREASTPRYAWFQPSVGDMLLSSIEGVNSIKINGETVEFEPYNEEYKSATYQEHIAMTEWDGDPYYTTTDKNGNTIYMMNKPTKLAFECCPLLEANDYFEIDDNFNPDDYYMALFADIDGQIDGSSQPLREFIDSGMLTIKDNKLQVNDVYSDALAETAILKVVGASIYVYIYNIYDPSATNYVLYGTTHHDTKIYAEEKHLIPCIEDGIETNVLRMELDLEPEKISAFIFSNIIQSKTSLICLEDGFYDGFSSTLTNYSNKPMALCNRVEIIGENLIKTYHKELTFPDTIRGIGIGSFAGNTIVEKVVLGENVVSISNTAFSGCTSLKQIEFTENIEYIGNRAFYDCTSLTDINDLNNVKYIAGNAFEGCENLKTTVVDNFVYIGNSYLVGYEDGNLLPSELIIPETASHIGENAFSNCMGLTSVVIPDNVKTIGEDAFYSCTNLTSVTLGNGLAPKECSYVDPATASLGAMLGADALNTTDIGDHAFNFCKKLNHVTCTAPQAPKIDLNTFGNMANYGTLTVPYGCNYEAWEECFLLYNWTINYLGAPTFDLNVTHELKKNR